VAPPLLSNYKTVNMAKLHKIFTKETRQTFLRWWDEIAIVILTALVNPGQQRRRQNNSIRSIPGYYGLVPAPIRVRPNRNISRRHQSHWGE
jgi:hypothetical protein